MQEQRYRQSSERQTDSRAGIIFETAGMDKDTAQTLLDRARCGEDAPARTTLSAPSLSFYRIKPGWHGVTYRCPAYEGASEYERNRIAHSLVLFDADLDVISWHPVSLIHAPFWNVGPGMFERVFTELPGVEDATAPTLESARAFVTGCERGEDLFATLLQAIIDRYHTHRSLLFVGEEPQIVGWIQALGFVLPTVLRRLLTFSTYEPDPEACHDLAVVGARPQDVIGWPALADKYLIIDIESTAKNRFVTDGVGARLAAPLIAGDDSTLYAIDRTATRLMFTTFRDLERALERQYHLDRPPRQPLTQNPFPPIKDLPWSLDWTGRLTGPLAEEAALTAHWPEMKSAALAQARQGDLSVWTALSVWSHEHAPDYLAERLTELLDEAEEEDVRAVRVIVDHLAATRTGPLASFFGACAALLVRSLELGMSQWGDDMRRCADLLLRSRDEATLLPILIAALKDNPNALMQSLRYILAANATLAATAAAPFFDDDAILEGEALRGYLRDPALTGFFAEIFADAHRSGRLAAFTRGVLDAIVRERNPRDGRHAISVALTCLQRTSASRAEYEEFFKQVPELTEYPDQHGRYLLAVLSESPVTMLPRQADFLALWKSLNAQAASTMTSIRPILTYKLTKARDVFQDGAGHGWEEARATLRVTNLTIPDEDYRAYLSQALRLLVDSKAPLVADSSIVDTFAVESHIPAFIEEYCRYLDAYRKKTDLYGSAASVAVGLAERFRFSEATQEAAARVIRHVGGNFRDELGGMLRSRYAQNPQGAAWWKEVAKRGQRSILGQWLSRASSQENKKPGGKQP